MRSIFHKALLAGLLRNFSSAFSLQSTPVGRTPPSQDEVPVVPASLTTPEEHPSKKLVSPTNEVERIDPGTGFNADETFNPIFEGGLRYKTNDWYKNLLSLPSSFVLKRTYKHLLFNTIISIVVTVAYKRAAWASIISMPMDAHNLLGGFLGLLLVFRQNTSYSRFWDARCSWSLAAATTRTLAIDIVTDLRPRAPESAYKLLTLVAAFPDALAYACLKGSFPLAHNVKKLVIPRAPRSNLAPATILCIMMQETIKQAVVEMGKVRDPLETLQITDLSANVNSLAVRLKECERILNTPVPWSYSRHASRFLSMYTATLPFAVVGTLGWMTIPVTAFLCWALFGIEEIGQ